MCQLRTAVDAVVESWWLDPISAHRLLQRTAEKLQYHQRRNAEARKSHTKTKKRKLQQRGITLKSLVQTCFDTS